MKSIFKDARNIQVEPAMELTKMAIYIMKLCVHDRWSNKKHTIQYVLHSIPTQNLNGNWLNDAILKCIE